jgi:hypothetical protein
MAGSCEGRKEFSERTAKGFCLSSI